MRLADQSDTCTDVRGDLGRYVDVPEDPDRTAEVLAGLHGGQRRAAAWLRGVLAQLDGRLS